MAWKLLLLITLTPCLSGLCDCKSIYNASALIDDLLADYKTVLRPRLNQSQAIHVSFAMEVLSLLEFDEVNGNLYLNAYLPLVWSDERLVWDPTNYDGIDYIMLENTKIWTPMIVHMNSVKKTEKLGSDDPWQLLRVYSDGSVSYYPGGLLSSSCNADVTYYPFDRHTCVIEFTAWGLVGTEMQLNINQTVVGQSFYSPNGIWEIERTAMSTKYQNLQVQAALSLRRKPLFIIFNVILPIVLMAFLNTLVFIIPIDSGERISYSLTMLLAVAVFLTLVGDNLPKTSSPMSIFSYYLLLTLILCVVFVGVNILSLRCYFAEEKEHINNHWKRLVKISRLSWRRRMRSVNVEKINDKGSSEKNGEQNLKYPSKDKDASSSVGVIREDRTGTDTVTWRGVSRAVDRIGFLTSLILTVGVTLIFMIVIYAGSMKAGT